MDPLGFEDDAANEDLDEALEDPAASTKPRFYCAGADLQDADGRKLCNHKARHRWPPPCPICNRWLDCLPIKRKNHAGVGYRAFALPADFKPRERIKTGIPEFDTVLGGGLLERNVLQLAGIRGVGKSTLMIKAAFGTARAGYNTMFVSGEMSEEATYEYAARLGILDGVDRTKIGVYRDPKTIDVKAVCAEIRARKIQVVFWDSLHVTAMSELKGDVGTAQQVTSVMNYLNSFAQDKVSHVSIVIVAHLTKEGTFAGTASGEHLSDGLIRFEHCPVYDDEGDLVQGTNRLCVLFLDGKTRQGDDEDRALLYRVRKNDKLVTGLPGDLVSVPSDLAQRIADADEELGALLGFTPRQPSRRRRLPRTRKDAEDREDGEDRGAPRGGQLVPFPGGRWEGGRPPNDRGPTPRGGRKRDR